jgi:hypothetical protein
MMTTMRRSLRRWAATAALVVALVAGLTSPNAAWADPQQVVAKTAQATAGKIRLEVMVVIGTPTGPVDPRVQDLARQFADLNIRGLRVHTSTALVLGEGQSGVVALGGGRKLELQLLSRTPQAARVRIQMSSGAQKKLDTTVSIPRNRSFVVGGPKLDEGKLIVPITAKY